tara:strand:- start:620 stop:1048 length:429 start_codon:yes stop_codon:yes gene_type:complete
MGRRIKTDNSIISTIQNYIFKTETYYHNGEFTITFRAILALFVIGIIAIWSITYYNTTKFTKTITVRKVYTRNRNKEIGDQYFVVDTDNIVYQVDNLWFKLDFNRADDWASLIEGHTYKVSGYGMRFGVADMYPTITSVEKV